MANLILRTQAKAFQTLKGQAVPTSGDQPEAVPYVLYDTQTFTSASTVQLTYFQAQQSDPRLSNMQGGGILPSPQWFEIHRVFVDVLSRPTVSTAAGTVPATGQIDDLIQLTRSGLAVATFTLASKTYGPYPLHFFGASGSVQGSSSVLSATTQAAASQKYEVGWQVENGGFPFNGNLIIPPTQNFGWTINWGATLTLAGGNPAIRLSMMGNLYRRVT